MLRKRSRKSLLTKREHHYHYQRKIIWHSVQDIDIRQHGFQAQESLGKKRECTMHCILGPNNMSDFDRQQMAMDVISGILYWGSEHREFDVAIKWLAEFMKYLWFSQHKMKRTGWKIYANSYYIDLPGKGKASKYIKCSKSMSRRNTRKYLFSERGSMNIPDFFV